MEARLHGQAASEALRIYARLGATGARFDGRRVANAVQTVRGRVRLSYALRRGFQRVSRIVAPVPRRREVRVRRVDRLARASGGGGSPRPRIAGGACPRG